MKLDHYLIPNTKINSKMDQRANVRHEIIKILEKNTSSNLFNTGHSIFLLDMSPEARETKAKMNYWDYIKIKSCTVKETSTKLKVSPRNRRKYLQMTHLIRVIFQNM